MKKIVSLLLVVVFFAMFTVVAFADIQRAHVVSPSLSFSGNTANCKVTVTDIGKEISATMSLWNGSTCIDSWSGSGTTVVTISGSCDVEPGKTYTLKVAGTIDGVPFSATPVSGVCK